jgi:hypothetical protein
MLGYMSYLLRVVFPDRPGALGAVGTALGKVSVDVVSLSVVERGPDGAVDDLLVVLPPGGLADTVLTAAHSVPGVRVEALRPYPAGGSGVRDDLELIDALAETPAEAPVVLTALAAGPFHADWAVLLERVADGDVRVREASVGAPDLHTRDLRAPDPRARKLDGPARVRLATPWLPLKRACGMSADGGGSPDFPARWRELSMELAAAPVGEGDVAVLLGRPGGPRFRDSEVARLAHLAGLAATLARSAPGVR